VPGPVSVDRLFPRWLVRVEPHERRAVLLAFVCHLVLYASYYILRPVRDTMATVFGSAQLQDLFTGTFIATLVASPIFATIASRVKIRSLLPGVFWFLIVCIALFDVLDKAMPDDRWVAGGYFVWFSTVNLFIVSVFWSLMVDTFTAAQATRLFAFIALGGEIGAILGPVLTRTLVKHLKLDGLLLLSVAGFVIVIGLVYWLIHEKERLRRDSLEVQDTTTDHSLSGNPFDGFTLLFKSRYVMAQAAFMLMMTWVNTVAYFMQTDLIARTFSAVESRAQAIADIDLVVNISTAAILLLGLGQMLRRFGVKAGLILNPLLMVPAFLAVLLWPSLLTIQLVQVVRRVAQYAIARPSREICFTVVEQESRYRAKNVIDTVIYRFGDLSSAWFQTGLRVAGLGVAGTVAFGVAASGVWAWTSVRLWRQYEALRAPQARAA
jgi:AAA family ATP:ADP antiporter